jgi:hypothetical protein
MTAASLSTALAFLGVLAGLGIGHLPGDILIQSHADATGKGYPSADRLAAGVHPWTGWPRCLRHTLSYLGCQAVTILLVWQVIPLPLPGILAALAISGSTHAVVDRRWLVQRILTAKGCTGWREAGFWTDQALHWTAIGLAAVVAARTTTFTWAAMVVGAGLLLIAYALHVEHRHARGVAAGPAPTDRL